MEKDWKVKQFYKTAWEITKAHKLLWIFGSAVAAFGGGVNRFNWQNNRTDFQKFFQNEPTKDQLTQVLGSSTNLLSQIFSNITPLYYIILVLEVLLTIGLVVAVVVISKAWSHGLLITASNQAIKKNPFSIRSSSENALQVIKPILWLMIVPFLVFFLISSLGFGLISLGLAFGNTAIKVVFAILLIVALGAFLYWLIFLALSQIWASRFAVLERKKGRQSLILGYKLAQKRFWPMILLATVNTLLTILVLGVPVAILTGIFGGGTTLLKDNPILGSTVLGLGALLSFIFALGFLLLNGVLTAFKFTVWNLGFNQSKN